jgi:hypothetical protein
MDLTNDDDVQMYACFHNGVLHVKEMLQKDAPWVLAGTKKLARPDQMELQSIDQWNVTKRTKVDNEKSTVTWLCEGSPKTFRSTPALAKYLKSTLVQNSRHGDIAQKGVVAVLADLRECIRLAEKDYPDHAILRLPVTRNAASANTVTIEEV